MLSPTIILLIIFAVAIISIVVVLVCYFTQKKYRNFVLQYSVCLHQLREINRQYNFYPYVNLNQSHTYDNENMYYDVSCQDYLIYQLQYIETAVQDQIKKVSANKQQYSEYLAKVNSITQFGQFSKSVGKLTLNKLMRVEKALLKKYTLTAPVTHFALMVTLYCSTIKGEVYAKKNTIFPERDVITLIKRLNNKSGYFYNDREIWDALCRVERAKVSNKMRFSIYERDGHKCCNCGISGRYATLEIDHIIPISKGGKSTYDNLQTLCHKCNVQKGNDGYNPYR